MIVKINKFKTNFIIFLIIRTSKILFPSLSIYSFFENNITSPKIVWIISIVENNFLPLFLAAIYFLFPWSSMCGKSCGENPYRWRGFPLRDNSFPRKLKIISRDFSTRILFFFWPFVINDATKMDTEIKLLSFTTKILFLW